jgi:hypothetical protein
VFWVRGIIIGGNELITYYDFEDMTPDWSKVVSQEFDNDNIVNQFTKDDNATNQSSRTSFPGSVTKTLSKDYSLTGRTSLKIVTSVNQAGDFKTIAYRLGKFTAEGAMIYVLSPNLSGVYVDYIQLCVITMTGAEWACSEGTEIIQGEWTPIVLDLRQNNQAGVAVAEQKLSELVVQWRFTTQGQVDFEFYIDSAEIFHSGK